MARSSPLLRPVRRAQDFYTPPPGLPANCWSAVAPAERVICYVEQVQQRRFPRPEGMLLGEVLIARVDAGRWVAQCPHCQSAQVVTPDDPRMWCVECQPDGWVQVRFPADPAAVEAEVAARPARERFWWAEDDTAWNRPRRRRPPSPKEIRRAEQQDQPTEPPADGGVTGASRNSPHVGGR